MALTASSLRMIAQKNMTDLENNPPALEVPPAPPVQAENPPSPAETAPAAPAAPPAAALVVHGEVTDERALAVERRERAAAEREARLLDVETNVSEREKKIQEREALLRGVKPAKVKKKYGWSDPVFNGEDENE